MASRNCRFHKQREEENNAQGMIEKEREKSMFPCPLTEMKPLK